jgi:trans-2-enoyl-CoA reductase
MKLEPCPTHALRLVFHQSGEPASVLHLEPFEPRPPQQGEVQVRMLYAPINPADLNYMEGTYGKLPAFPAVPGNEGCGRIEAVGLGVDTLTVGDLVIPTKALGVWSSLVVAASDQWLKLPSGINPIQASMLRVNPVTAWQMLHTFRNLKKGDFIVQNAANSGVGRSVIQIAQHLGLRTINFVRRMDLSEELISLGADYVFSDDDAGLQEALKAVEGTQIVLALNAVGGDSALRQMELLAANGAHITYGAMSRRSLKVPNKYLIFKNLELRGYWLTLWMDHAPVHELQKVLLPLAEMMRDNALKLLVAEVYEMEDFNKALQALKLDNRSGKVLLKIT